MNSRAPDTTLLLSVNMQSCKVCRLPTSSHATAPSGKHIRITVYVYQKLEWFLEG